MFVSKTHCSLTRSALSTTSSSSISNGVSKLNLVSCRIIFTASSNAYIILQEVSQVSLYWQIKIMCGNLSMDVKYVHGSSCICYINWPAYNIVNNLHRIHGNLHSEENIYILSMLIGSKEMWDRFRFARTKFYCMCNVHLHWSVMEEKCLWSPLYLLFSLSH